MRESGRRDVLEGRRRVGRGWGQASECVGGVCAALGLSLLSSKVEHVGVVWREAQVGMREGQKPTISDAALSISQKF